MDLTLKLLSNGELEENSALFSGSTFMQTKFWGDFKGKYGFSPLYFKITYNGESSGLMVLLRPLFLGFSLAYVPHGPREDWSTENFLDKLSIKIKEFLPKKCFFLRFDLLSGTRGDVFPTPLGGSLKKSLAAVQVPDTTILNLTPSLDTILANMHKKTRYNINLGPKKGVTTRVADYSEIEKWYHMYKETAKRDSIAIHSLSYYKDVYKSAKENPNVDIDLLFSEHEGELLAGIFVLYHNKGATYLYGASSNNKRNLMPAYCLQFHGIQEAKRRGCKWYDFFGIPPVNSEDHPMYGLYRFKIGFGGEIIHRHGAWDYPLSPLYIAYSLLEKLRFFYYKRIRR